MRRSVLPHSTKQRDSRPCERRRSRAGSRTPILNRRLTRRAAGRLPRRFHSVRPPSSAVYTSFGASPSHGSLLGVKNNSAYTHSLSGSKSIVTVIALGQSLVNPPMQQDTRCEPYPATSNLRTSAPAAARIFTAASIRPIAAPQRPPAETPAASTATLLSSKLHILAMQDSQSPATGRRPSRVPSTCRPNSRTAASALSAAVFPTARAAAFTAFGAGSAGTWRPASQPCRFKRAR